MIKKYGWKYLFVIIGAFFLGVMWPFGFFVAYMFNDVKDESKKKLIKSINITSIIWLIMDILYAISIIVSNLFEKGII